MAKTNYKKSSSSKEDYKKRSGCKLKNSFVSQRTGEKFDMPLITAWNYSQRNGLLSLIASPRRKGSDTSNENQKMFTCKVTYSDKRKPEYFLGFWNRETKKLTIPELQMVANPNAPDGGYFGRFYKTK